MLFGIRGLKKLFSHSFFSTSATTNNSHFTSIEELRETEEDGTTKLWKISEKDQCSPDYLSALLEQFEDQFEESDFLNRPNSSFEACDTVIANLIKRSCTQPALVEPLVQIIEKHPSVIEKRFLDSDVGHDTKITFREAIHNNMHLNNQLLPAILQSSRSLKP